MMRRAAARPLADLLSGLDLNALYPSVGGSDSKLYRLSFPERGEVQERRHSSPAATTCDAIEEMLEQSQTLWGLSVPHFICVSKSIATNCVSIDEAVAKTEGLESHDDFLIVAYQDGGLISISGRLLPFQEIAEPAEWWRPKD